MGFCLAEADHMPYDNCQQTEADSLSEPSRVYNRSISFAAASLEFVYQ
jgi:hypothetical protein